jgi:hypothetical protein
VLPVSCHQFEARLNTLNVNGSAACEMIADPRFGPTDPGGLMAQELKAMWR